MTIYQTTGFEYISGKVAATNWSATYNKWVDVKAEGRRSGRALAVGNLSGGGEAGTAIVSQVCPTGLTSVCLGCAIDVNNYPDPSVYLLGSALAYTKYHTKLVIGSTGTVLTAYNTSGVSAGSCTVDFTSYHYLEIVLDVVADTLKVYVDEELVLDLVGDFSYSSDDVGYFGFRGHSITTSPPAYFLVDDLYLASERLGDIACIYLPGTSDVSTTFTSTGATDYEVTDEIPENDADYTQSAVSGDKSILGRTVSLGSVAGDILSVSVVSRMNVPDGGIGIGIVPALKLGGIEYTGTTVTGTTITKSEGKGTFLINPATGAAFTVSEVEALQGFGWEIGS